jgi:hypothetical protein
LRDARQRFSFEAFTAARNTVFTDRYAAIDAITVAAVHGALSVMLTVTLCV